MHKVSRGDTSVSMGIVKSPAAATDGACRRVVIMMSGSDFVRFRAASCHGWIAGDHREQNDRHNPRFHRPTPLAVDHGMILVDHNGMILKNYSRVEPTRSASGKATLGEKDPSLAFSNVSCV